MWPSIRNQPGETQITTLLFRPWYHLTRPAGYKCKVQRVGFPWCSIFGFVCGRAIHPSSEYKILQYTGMDLITMTVKYTYSIWSDGSKFGFNESFDQCYIYNMCINRSLCRQLIYIYLSFRSGTVWYRSDTTALLLLLVAGQSVWWFSQWELITLLQPDRRQGWW